MQYTIIKRNHKGIEKARYSGELLERGPNFVQLRAVFEMEGGDKNYMVLRQGDIFTEWHYSDRWYNVFRITDGATGQLKAYYCNLARPTELYEDYGAADDLKLDFVVTAAGATILLDQDELAEIALPEAELAAIWDAVRDLRLRVLRRADPFHEL